MKRVINFALYDFANSAFTTIIITFIFSTYFAKQIAPNPILGQSYWGWTIGLTGILVAIIGPILGNYADKRNYTEIFIKLFTIICISLTTLLWFSKPSEKYLLFATTSRFANPPPNLLFNSIKTDGPSLYILYALLNILIYSVANLLNIFVFIEETLCN